MIWSYIRDAWILGTRQCHLERKKNGVEWSQNSWVDGCNKGWNVSIFVLQYKTSLKEYFSSFFLKDITYWKIVSISTNYQLYSIDVVSTYIQSALLKSELPYKQGKDRNSNSWVTQHFTFPNMIQKQHKNTRRLNQQNPAHYHPQ